MRTKIRRQNGELKPCGGERKGAGHSKCGYYKGKEVVVAKEEVKEEKKVKAVKEAKKIVQKETKKAPGKVTKKATLKRTTSK